MPCCDIFEKWRAEENLLRMYNYWIVAVRTKQPTLGSCIAILKRHAESFADVRQEEMAEFLEIAKDLETVLKKTFNFWKINYLVLMLADSHFHLHVIPRYAGTKEFADKIWKDLAWPHPLGHSELNIETENSERLTAIRDEVQKNF